MSSQDRDKWDARYSAVSATAGWSPSPLLEDALVELRRRVGEVQVLDALDVACGGGRNSLMLAASGFRVDGLDVSREGLALARRREQTLDSQEAGTAGASGRRKPVRWLEADLDEGLPVSEPYDLILMIRYMDLNLLGGLRELLRPGGMLVVELHLALNAEEGGGQDPGENFLVGPRNPDFLVQSGDLAACCQGLEVWAMKEGRSDIGDGRQEALAQFVGFRRSEL